MHTMTRGIDANSENVAGARDANGLVHFLFRFENGHRNKSLCSIHAHKKCKMREPQAQLTGD